MPMNMSPLAHEHPQTADRPARVGTVRTGARWSAAYTGLRDAILTHGLPPGTKLPEDEVGEIYAVSRTVVRSALQALAHDRLVTLEPNRSAFVAKPTTVEAREVFEARALIEPKVASLAANVARPKDIALLRQHLAEEHELVHAGKDGEAVVMSGRFHVAIAEIAGQSILTDYVRGLCSRSSLIISLYWHRRATICDGLAHNGLVDAIERHASADAASLMHSHLVDLLSGLDLSDAAAAPPRLADILKRA
jgi:DNA-binding GntR family transcriptional regulator